MIDVSGRIRSGMPVHYFRQLHFTRGERVNPYCLPRKRFKIPEIKPDVIITGVVTICAGGFHAWCESNVGLVRKELKNIPRHLIEDYARRVDELIDFLLG